MTAARAFRAIALTAYTSLIVLNAAWEAWGAAATPVPRSFWIALKTLPLLVLLPPLARGGARIHVIAALVVLIYFCEGVANGYDASRHGASLALYYAAAEVALSILFVVSAPVYARLAFRRRLRGAAVRTES